MQTISRTGVTDRSLVALAFLNFFLADARDGLGPFLDGFLATNGWSPMTLGIIATLGGVLGMVATPLFGAWVDASKRKRMLIIIPVVLVTAKVEFECEWYGKIGMTDNALPRFHRFAPNVVGFSGYNGRGIAPGTVFGRTLAQLILREIGEDELPLPVSDIREPSFRGMKEAYYETGAQIAHFAGERF